MILPLLIIGLVLWFAGPWFEGQETVGIIVTLATAGLFIVQLLFIAIVGAFAWIKGRKF